MSERAQSPVAVVGSTDLEALMGSGDKGDLTVSVPKAQMNKVPKPHTVYIVTVERGQQTWTVQRRYNQFLALNEALTQAFPTEKFKLPPKKVIHNMDSSFVQKRRLELERYLQDAVSRSGVADSEHMRRFLDINEGVDITHEEDEEALQNRNRVREETAAMQELRGKLRAGVAHEIEAYVRDQKIKYLTDGSFLNEYRGSKSKPMLRFVRLSSDRRHLLYEAARPGVKAQFTNPETVPVEAIRQIATGKEVPSLASAKADVLATALALVLDDSKSIDFVALNKYDHANWVDGLRALRGLDLIMPETLSAIETLQDIEVEMALCNQPEIPPPPNEFDV